MGTLKRSLLFGLRTVLLLAVDVWVLMTYWAAFHPGRSTCGFAGVGCQINTGLYLVLLAIGIALLAGIIDAMIRKPRDLQDAALSLFYALLILVLAAGANLAADKNPVFRDWLFGLFPLG